MDVSRDSNVRYSDARSGKRPSSSQGTLNWKKRGASHTSVERSQTRTMSGLRFTNEELNLYLHERTAVLPVSEGNSMAKPLRNEEGICCTFPDQSSNLLHNVPANSVDILQLRYKPGVQKEFCSTEEFNKVIHAIRTVPSQVQLCYSSIPGAGFGVCAKQSIPSGMWVGPYEGKEVPTAKIKSFMSSKHVWEVYKNGKIDHYIDGSDSRHSAWMKYIQCARNENEQNMVVFQFGADIYFQTYKKIEIGEELLVWYAEYYEQYYGIPVGVRNLAKTKGCSETATRTNEILARPDNHVTSQDNKSEKPRHCLGQLITAQQFNSHSSMRVNFGKIQKQDRISSTERNTFSQPIVARAVSMANSKHKESTTTDEDVSPTHMDSVQTRFWKCEHCLDKFPQKWALQVHVCPCEVSQPLKCSHCREAFIDKEDLLVHTQNCGSGRPYKCGYCGRNFAGVNTLTKHLRVHSRQKLLSGKKRRGRISNYEKFVLQKEI